MVCFIGFYLLNTGIKQSFKISQNGDLKTVFEDDLKLHDNKAIQGYDLIERIEFTKKNMVSHKKYLLISSIFIIFFGYFYVEIMISLPIFTLGMLIIFLLPFFRKIIFEIIRWYISKELLYVCGYCLSFFLFFTMLILKNRNIADFTFLYFCKYINLYTEAYLTESLFDNSLKKIDESSE